MNHVQQQELTEAARVADVATPRKATRIRYYMLALILFATIINFVDGRVSVFWRRLSVKILH
jgi:ACS family D-galactonate transporter-like MFS transporter